MDKNLCIIENSVNISPSAVIKPYCIIINSTIGDNTVIESFSRIENSVIGNNVTVISSQISDSTIEDNTHIGPYSHIIKNSIIKPGAYIGNFVEVKNSTVGENTKSKHLSYIGDSVIGKDCNIGCGVIFANYNGKEKNKMVVGDNVFIGSNSVIIAPVNIMDNCYICAGTNLTKDLDKDSFVIARSREVIKPGYAKKYVKSPKNKQ